MIRKLFLLILVLFILCSCAVHKVTYYEKPVDKVENIVLLSTMIGSPGLNPIPLIDAAIFNPKVRSKAREIAELEKRYVDQFRENLASAVKNKLNAKVIYGPNLHSMPEYIELKNKYNFPEALKIDDEYFPEIIIASGDINPFKFIRGDVREFFKKEVNYKQTIAEIAKTLNADLIIISYSHFLANAGVFGIYGALFLNSSLYIFNKEGELVFSADAISTAKSTSGTDIADYQETLEKFPTVIEPVITEVINKLKQ